MTITCTRLPCPRPPTWHFHSNGTLVSTAGATAVRLQAGGHGSENGAGRVARYRRGTRKPCATGGRRAYGRWGWRRSGGGGGGAENSSADLGRIRIAERSSAEQSRVEQRAGGCARGSGWEQVGRQGYSRTGYGQVRGLHELARNRAGVGRRRGGGRAAGVASRHGRASKGRAGRARMGLRGSCGR
jgi:hypothetical protein